MIFPAGIATDEPVRVPMIIVAVLIYDLNDVEVKLKLSAYNLVTASVLSVGVARLMIFWELRLNDPVGADIEFKTVVFK